MQRMKRVLLVAVCAVTAGCAGVKPWQRSVLARDDMQIVSEPLDSAIDEHIYFSKEASTGGSSVAGGGCGCN